MCDLELADMISRRLVVKGLSADVLWQAPRTGTTADDRLSFGRHCDLVEIDREDCRGDARNLDDLEELVNCCCVFHALWQSWRLQRMAMRLSCLDIDAVTYSVTTFAGLLMCCTVIAFSESNSAENELTWPHV